MNTSEHRCGYGDDPRVRCLDCFRSARAAHPAEEPLASAPYAPLNSPFTMLRVDRPLALNGRQVEHRQRMLRHLQSVSGQ